MQGEQLGREQGLTDRGSGYELSQLSQPAVGALPLPTWWEVLEDRVDSGDGGHGCHVS